MKTILNFLTELKANNNRDWFNENRNQYVKAKSDFEDLINRIIPAIHHFDPDIGSISAKQCVFRIFRDVRFSKDKSPYKTNMGGFIARGGRKGGFAGYYLHLDPEQSFIAGGMHMPFPEELKKVRQEIKNTNYTNVTLCRLYATLPSVARKELHIPVLSFLVQFLCKEPLRH